MNTKTITDKVERKAKKRASRKAAPAEAKRATGVARRGSMKRKVKKMVKGQRKR